MLIVRHVAVLDVSLFAVQTCSELMHLCWKVWMVRMQDTMVPVNLSEKRYPGVDVRDCSLVKKYQEIAQPSICRSRQ
jgi:hypothetical protein